MKQLMTRRQRILGVLNVLCLRKPAKWRWFRRLCGGTWAYIEEEAWLDGVVRTSIRYWVLVLPGTQAALSPGAPVVAIERWGAQPLPPARVNKPTPKES